MLKQVQVRYDAVEDRMLLSIRGESAGAPINHLLLLTRRVWAAARQTLQVALDDSAEAPDRLEPQVRRSLSNAHHQAQTSKADVKHNQAPQPLPDSTKLALVTALRCGRRASDGRWVLEFVLRDRDEISLVLSTPTLHGIIGALVAQEANTGWGLQPLPVSEPVPAAATQSSLH